MIVGMGPLSLSSGRAGRMTIMRFSLQSFRCQLTNTWRSRGVIVHFHQSATGAGDRPRQVTQRLIVTLEKIGKFGLRSVHATEFSRLGFVRIAKRLLHLNLHLPGIKTPVIECPCFDLIQI